MSSPAPSSSRQLEARSGSLGRGRRQVRASPRRQDEHWLWGEQQTRGQVADGELAKGASQGWMWPWECSPPGGRWPQDTCY